MSGKQSISIREGRLEDAEALAAITVEAWQTAYTDVLDPAFAKHLKKEDYTAKFRQILSPGEQTVRVAELGGRVVGFISGLLLEEGGYDCEIKGLYIRPQNQGKGIGRALLKVMQAHFRAQGCRSLIVWTLRGVKNNAFYVKMGGIAQEAKDQQLGEKRYQMVGYRFDLSQKPSNESL